MKNRPGGPVSRAQGPRYLVDWKTGTGLAFITLPKRSVTVRGGIQRTGTGFRRQKNNNYKNNKIQIQ
jgi:hypothetical protein